MGSHIKQPLSCDDYHVAWICPVADIELLPARLMLDEEHPTPPYQTYSDENTYICGTINGHTIVIATCPLGQTGNVNTGRLTGSMFKTFPCIRMTVLVGIGSGVPATHPSVTGDPLDDIHLGDVVVGWPGDSKPACVHYDVGRSEIVGAVQNPDWRLTNALSILVSDQELGRTTFSDQLSRLHAPGRRKSKAKFTHPGLEADRLFKATYRHTGTSTSDCTTCDESELVERPQRTEASKDELVFHQGRIATTSASIQDGELRDRISSICSGVMCIETEAAGVDINRRCLVVRGIADYADSHKISVWKSYAAGNAAAFARELLCKIQPSMIENAEEPLEHKPLEAGEVMTETISDLSVSEAPWSVPFARPQTFVGRKALLDQLSAHVSMEDSRRIAVYGLGGCGKTALILEFLYQVRAK